ncbi:hypothetical protein J6590_000502 [Homalodisca vitripennis]|nr:hypothetical protein J6590_000502 [Homalodisca vitripennis]
MVNVFNLAYHQQRSLVYCLRADTVVPITPPTASVARIMHRLWDSHSTPAAARTESVDPIVEKSALKDCNSMDNLNVSWITQLSRITCDSPSRTYVSDSGIIVIGRGRGSDEQSIERGSYTGGQCIIMVTGEVEGFAIQITDNLHTSRRYPDSSCVIVAGTKDGVSGKSADVPYNLCRMSGTGRCIPRQSASLPTRHPRDLALLSGSYIEVAIAMIPLRDRDTRFTHINDCALIPKRPVLSDPA